MADPIIKFKRSAVPGKKPTVEQLPLGELAINTYDGKLFLRQDTGGVGIATRVVAIGAGTTAGKTFFVTSNGSDSNTGLSIGESFASIKAAAAAAVEKDTIKVLPGTYVENNPIYLPKNVGVEGAELRNCLVSAQNPDQDLFYVGQGNHLTDLSFIGQPATNGAAVIAYTPLVGVSSDIYFDAANLIRQNIQYISHEAVGYVTSTDYRFSTHTITNAQYSPITGIMTCTVASHGFNTGDVVRFDHASVTFQCSYGSGGNDSYPRPSDYAMNRDLPITKIDADTFKVNILETAPSTNTGIHTFINAVGDMKKGGESIKIATNSLTFTCDMDNHGSEHSYPRTTDPYYNTSIPIVSTTSDTITVNVGISSLVYHTPTDATYNPANGDLVVTIGSHKLMVGKNVKIATDSLGFTCDKDNNTVTKYYPRKDKDPAYNTSVAVGATTLNTVTLQIGAQAGGLVAPLQMEFLASILENSTT